MSWTAVRVEAADSPHIRTTLLTALFAHGAAAVQEDGRALVTSYPAGADLSGVRSAILTVDPTARVDVVPLADVDWSEAWKARVSAHTLGRLTVGPPWLVDASAPGSVAIDPGMGFGTGDHASTRGVLRLMQEIVRPGSVVADVGTGSGVLAIAAAKLGAARVAAIELDPDAIGNAESNVARNGVGDRVSVIAGDGRLLLPLLAPLELIMANLLGPLVAELSPVILAALAPGGRAIAAGMLVGERAAMRDRLARDGWVVEGEDIEAGMDASEEGSWWSVAVTRP